MSHTSISLSASPLCTTQHVTKLLHVIQETLTIQYNQSVLFQETRPIKTTHTRHTGTNRRTTETETGTESLQMTVRNVLKLHINNKHAFKSIYRYFI